MLIDVTGIPKSCPFHIHIKLSMTAQQALIVFMSVDISGHDSVIEKTKHRIEIYKHVITTDYQINNKLVSNCANNFKQSCFEEEKNTRKRILQKTLKKRHWDKRTKG